MSSGDFHTHSTRSDGTLAPAALVDLAAQRGVRVMALTDHDTLDGIDEARAAASRHPGFTLVPGVELSCDVPGTEVHMLGLFVDPSGEGGDGGEGGRHLVAELARFRRGRVERGRKMVEALSALGARIDWRRVQEIAGDASSIGRPHVAQALVERGHVSSLAEAFERFLGRDGPAYVERERLAPREAIALIRDAGGLAIFAHPSFTEDYEQVAAELAAAGLFGMEAYYRAYEPPLVERLRTLADHLGLFALGGSDYHGLARDGEREPGDIPLPDSVTDRLLAAARDYGCPVPTPAPAA